CHARANRHVRIPEVRHVPRPGNTIPRRMGDRPIRFVSPRMTGSPRWGDLSRSGSKARDDAEARTTASRVRGGSPDSAGFNVNTLREKPQGIPRRDVEPSAAATRGESTGPRGRFPEAGGGTHREGVFPCRSPWFRMGPADLDDSEAATLRSRRDQVDVQA